MLVDAPQEEPNTTDEEADVADSLIPTEMESPMPSSSRLTPRTEDLETPVRRSSRPRKSLLDSPLRSESTPKNKGKGKADVPASETTPRPKFDVPRREMSPLRAQLKESERVTRRPLDSLSPGTVGLLGTLVPSKTPSPLPEVNEAEPSLVLPFRFPKASASATNLPFRLPNRSPSPRRDPPASPTRSLLRDDPQTPSRKISIEEALANLRSPTKTSGGKSFKLKILPTDSPARRGPPPIADSLTTPRPLPTSILVKPLSSPTRSRSVEPSPTARTKRLVRSGSAEPSIPSLPFRLLPPRSRMPPSIPEDAEASTPISTETSSSNPPLQPLPQKSVLRQHTPSKIPRPKPYARPASSINVNKSRLPMRQLDFSTAPKPTVALKPKMKATVEIDSSRLKRKRSTPEELSQSPLKIPNLRLVPSISSPSKPPLRKLHSSPTEDDTAEVGTSAGTSVPSASQPTELALPEPRSSIVESSIPQPSESSSAVRRTTRTRRSITPSTDIFPKPAAELPPPRQRKPPAVRSELNLFRGLTPAAWTSMTKSNTAKNEAYQAAKLEIKVVRKEGIRPDSPILKVKTKSQKEQDERGRQRSERARDGRRG
ncbi:hypothetical protein BDZ89DRAFT_289255 [Hymenopellis radicata]|nr:hypothetical protein BDZ89DRAFT_289255 [Hymenopellis radicata]